MGMCLPCLNGAHEDVVETPDPETRRKQLAEAAEKRQKEATNRGIKNPEALERKKKKLEEMEKQAKVSEVSGQGGGLKTKEEKKRAARVEKRRAAQEAAGASTSEQMNAKHTEKEDED